MANEIKYLSYDGLTHYTEKLFGVIEDDEEVIATSLVDLDTRLKSHTHSYVASAGYSASAARATYAATSSYSGSAGYSASAAKATYAASAGYSASAARATYAATSSYSGSAGYSASASKATYAASAGYSASAARATSAASAGYAAIANKVTNPLIIQGHIYDGTATKTVSIKELTIANSNTATWYYPTFVTGTSVTTLNINSGFKVYASNASSTSYGDITFAIGRAATGTIMTQKGFLRIYGESNNGLIRGPQGTSGASYEIYLPAEAGTLVVNNTSGNISANSFTENGTSLANKYAAKTHTHTYVASAGYSASAAKATYAASAGYSASAARATSAASAGYAATAARSVTAARAVYSASAGYAATAGTVANIKINLATTSVYYPMVFTNVISSNNAASLYIDGSTGTAQTSYGIRYNPSTNACYCSGGFYELSDESTKNFGDDIEVNLDKLSKLSKKYFTWKDDESNTQHIGVSAQEIRELYPELVNDIDEEGHLSVSYDKLSVVALKGIDVLNDKVKSLEERLERLEKLIEG